MKTALLILIFVFLITCSCYAHPPSGIEASYGKDINALKADIIHPVRNPKNHYIDKIEVSYNGDIVSNETFTSQTNNNIQSINIKSLDLKPGDEIIIEAKCNMYGRLKQTIRL